MFQIFLTIGSQVTNVCNWTLYIWIKADSVNQADEWYDADV